MINTNEKWKTTNFPCGLLIIPSEMAFRLENLISLPLIQKSSKIYSNFRLTHNLQVSRHDQRVKRGRICWNFTREFARRCGRCAREDDLALVGRRLLVKMRFISVWSSVNSAAAFITFDQTHHNVNSGNRKSFHCRILFRRVSVELSPSFVPFNGV